MQTTEADTAELRSFAQLVERDGWASVDNVIDEPALTALEADLAPLIANAAARGGVRNLLNESLSTRAMAQSTSLRTLATSILGPDCGVVRAIYFDKTPETNWRVMWHQDLAIAVRSEHATPGYGPWSEKAGVVHVHPPADILSRMLAVRVHLDDCDADNGPVRVLPGSHRSGRLSAADIDVWKTRVAPQECYAWRGGVLAFRPLLLHASSPARTPRHRRVLHFEFAASDLAPGLQWHSWVGAEGS